MTGAGSRLESRTRICIVYRALISAQACCRMVRTCISTVALSENAYSARRDRGRAESHEVMYALITESFLFKENGSLVGAFDDLELV